MPDESEKYRQDAYRTEYSIVATTWQSFQRERLLLAGTALATATVLAGAYRAGIGLVGSLEENRTMAVFVPLVPITGIMLVILAWTADITLQRAQRTAWARGAELERLLGIERGFFFRLHSWRMPYVLGVSLRELVVLGALAVCVVAYWLPQSPQRPPETVIPKQDRRAGLDAPPVCNCQCSCPTSLVPKYPMSIIPAR